MMKNIMETNNKHKIKNTIENIFELETYINIFLKMIFTPSLNKIAMGFIQIILVDIISL